MRGIVDRIEAGKVAVEIENEIKVFSKEFFPDNISEGDVVWEEDGQFFIDRCASEKREEEIGKLFQRLKKKKDKEV